MWHRLAHRVGRSSQATPAAVDKSTQRLEHKNSDKPVGVVAEPALPGIVRIAGVDLHPVPVLNSLCGAVSSPWSYVKLWRKGAAIEFKLGETPVSAEAAVALSILASSTRRLECSTSTPTQDSLPAPLMKSPSQWPGITRLLTSAGPTWMLTISEIRPRRSVPRMRGMLVLRTWRKQAMSWRRSSPRG